MGFFYYKHVGWQQRPSHDVMVEHKAGALLVL